MSVSTSAGSKWRSLCRRSPGWSWPGSYRRGAGGGSGASLASTADAGRRWAGRRGPSAPRGRPVRGRRSSCSRAPAGKTSVEREPRGPRVPDRGRGVAQPRAARRSPPRRSAPPSTTWSSIGSRGSPASKRRHQQRAVRRQRRPAAGHRGGQRAGRRAAARPAARRDCRRRLRRAGHAAAGGRTFTAADGRGPAPWAIVNGSHGRCLWPGRDAVGRRFALGPAAAARAWSTVVGVVGDMRRQGLFRVLVPQMFEPIAQALLLTCDPRRADVAGRSACRAGVLSCRRAQRRAGRRARSGGVRRRSAGLGCC